MSGAPDYEKCFISYIRLERLQSSLSNPEDIMLLNNILHQNMTSPDPSLQAICGFAMAKGGVSERNWCTVVFRADLVSLQVGARLRNHNDQNLLRNFVSERVYMEYPDAALWAVYDFAVAKGQESFLQWRLELDATIQQELAEEAAQARRGPWTKLRRRFASSG